MSLVLSVLSFYLIQSAEIFDCDTPQKCKNEHLWCAGEECIVICSAIAACEYTIVHCPQTNGCNITCNSSTDGPACQHAIFNVYDVSNVTITSLPDQFENGAIHCGVNSKCHLQCGLSSDIEGNYEMCKSSIINASAASVLNITGMGQEVLSYSQIYCPAHGDCIVHLIGTSIYKFSQSKIYIDDPHNVNLELICDNYIDGSPCYGSPDNAPILYCYNETYECVYVTINGIDWFCQNSSQCDPPPTTNIPTYAPTTHAPHHAGVNGVSAGIISVLVLLVLGCCAIIGYCCYGGAKERLNHVKHEYAYLLNELPRSWSNRSKSGKNASETSLPAISPTPSRVLTLNT